MAGTLEYRKARKLSQKAVDVAETLQGGHRSDVLECKRQVYSLLKGERTENAKMYRKNVTWAAEQM